MNRKGDKSLIVGIQVPALLAGDGRALERADFRYANGFAVRWRAEESDTPRKES